MHAEPFFLPAGMANRFCLFHAAAVLPHAPPRGQILYLHPFAEEMNKSRRMAALQSRALVGAGFDVLQVDLTGCGDSSGGFEDATWDGWLQDAADACHWLRNRAPAQAIPAEQPTLWLWGLRSGCLLAAALAQTLAEPANLLLWSPVVSGKTHLQQFLRLKAAADLGAGNAKEVMGALRSDLLARRTVEVAGYPMTANLALGLESATLAPAAPSEHRSLLHWFELSSRPDALFTPAAKAAAKVWSGAGFDVRTHLVQGPAFWQTTEIEDAPALIAATTAALAESAPA